MSTLISASEITVRYGDRAVLDSTTLGINGTSITSATTAASAMAALDTAISTISTERATVGATQSRFAFQSDVINTSLQNLSSATSAIMDADIAQEQTNYSSAQTLTSAAISALSDANSMNQSLLKLLQ